MIRYHLPTLTFEIDMRLFELFETKSEKKIVKSPPPRNFVAKNAKTTGAGPHKSKKFNRTEKHKKPAEIK
jgi:hypothetical protein